MSRAAFMEFLNSSVMGSMFTRYKTPAYVNLDFTPTFTPRLLRKDFDLGLQAARDLDVPMPVVAAAHQAVQALIGSGYEDVDFAALIELEARQSGLDARVRGRAGVGRPVGSGAGGLMPRIAVLPDRGAARPGAARLPRARRAPRHAAAREPGDPRSRARGAALVLDELGPRVPQRRARAPGQGALPRVRLQDDRMPLLREPTVSPGRRARA